MGMKLSPFFSQEVMKNIFRHQEDTDIYIDDVGAFSASWTAHIKLLDEILRLLKYNGFTVNSLKCEWSVKEADWLGYWITPTGLKPCKKKVGVVLQLDHPKTLRHLKTFL